MATILSARRLSSFALIAAAMLLANVAQAASASLTIEPITWNVIGLDSNSPATGPNRFPVGARVCSSVATTNVEVEFIWDTPSTFIDLRPGSLSTITIDSIGAGQCEDAYFEVEVDKDPAAFDETRGYHITATDASGDVSTPAGHELYVEYLISQSRNAVTDVKYGPDPLNLTSVAPGAGMSLVVGNTYTIQLLGGTATQGYNQFEAFINFPNTIFQVLAVETTYSANDSPFVSGPAPAVHDQLYADACGWENDPNSPNYRACVGGDFKSGGSDVVTTYTIKVIGGGGTSEALNTLLYDFSGSSFHYNADFGTGARIANIIDPTSATIEKAFSPNPAGVNGISVLTFTLTNPNGGTLGGYNFVDNLPAGLEVASTPAVATSGCGTPTVTAVAGSGSIGFSNGTLAANSNCVVRVNVTPTAITTYNNTTGNLFIDSVDTGDDASASLVVNADAPGTGICGTTLAGWSVPNGTTANPPDLTGGVPTTKAGNVTTATLAAGIPANTSILASSGHGDSTSWRTWGYRNDGQTLTFTIDTSDYTDVEMSFWMANPSPANGPTAVTVSVNSGSGFGAPVLTINNPAAAFTQHTIDLTGLTSTTGNTLIRIAATGANADSSGASLNFDDMTFTGCTTATDPTISKSFSPDPIAVNGTSTLTFTIANPNSVALTGAKFSDTLPAGVQVAATPSASTTCGGSPSWAPAAGATVLDFGQTTGATIPAAGSCTVTVNVTATTSGPHSNVSGFLFTTETGTVTESIASDTLTAVLPPEIEKQFAPSPIVAGATSTLTFTITNPNQDDALSGVAFSDTFPVAPGAMRVAAVPNASTSGCGSPTFSPSAASGSIAFSGGSLAAGGTCTVTVDVTAPTAGTYNNTSGNVSHVINAATVNGNTASDSLTVNPPNPSISLLKQVSTSPTGPWTSFVAVASGNVHYRFTVENIGDVPLDSIGIDDDTLNVATCNAAFASLTLEVADANDDDHIATCVVGPVAVTSGSHENTATAEGSFSGSPVTSDPSIATFATTALTLDKSSTDTFTSAGNQIDYTYEVTNSGFAPLEGPVDIDDDKVADGNIVCQPLTAVGDNDNFLDPGESVDCSGAYLATAGDVTAGFVTNVATASVDGVDSNSDTVTVVSTASADISLTKTLTTVGPHEAGDSVSFDIVVANAGPSTATNVQVTDVDTNLTVTGVSGSGCAALPCTIASINSGANATITVTATIDAAGAFENEATADGAEPDPTPGNNTDDDGDTAAASADVSLTKTLTTAGPYTVGDSVSFDIVVANAGPSAATNVQVTDTDTNLTVTGVSGSGCAALPCTIASINSGANTTITVTATIDAAGAFENEATADADEPDPTPGNNTDDDGDTADASADVSLTKTLTTAGPYTVGDSVSFDIVVANAGPSAATNVQVSDVPTNLTVTGVSGSGCAALPCTIASINSGANTTITVTATIDAAGAFENDANADADEPDPTPGNNSDDDGDTAGASADVSLTKTLTTAGPFTVGDTVSFDIVVANAGPSTATNVQVTDVDTNLTITGVSGSGCAALPCNIGALSAGTDTTITVTATIDANGAFENEATADGDEPDPTPGNNTDDDGDIAGPSADVSLTKTLTTAGPYTVGDSVSFDIVVANAGPSAATNVQVTDTDTNLTVTGVSGSGCAALPCTIASINSGANTTITVTATIDAAGAFENEATADADEPDPTPGNNTDDDGDTAGASADVSLTKTLTTAGPYTVGDSVSFDIVVANAGPSAATNVQVSDVPTNLTVTGVSGSGCAALPCTIASINSGANTTITVTATIDAAGAFENEATADADEPDPTPGNNTDDDGDTAGASADVSLTKTLTTAGPFTVGDSVSFDIVVANAGPSTATNVQVTDVDTNLTVTGVSGSGCAALPCTIGALSSGTDTTITVTATIDANGAFENEATADGDEPDPTPGNNTDDDGDIAGPSANLSLTKTLTTAGPYTVGDTVSFDIVVANAGPSAATNVDVTDTDTNLTITGVSGSGCAALPCTIASINSGANATITVTATIDAAGAFGNEATATGDEPDPDSSDNTDDDGDTAGAEADVSLTKTLTTAGPYTVGDTVSFDIVVANAGPSAATNVQVTDTDTNLTITGVSGSGCAALPCTIASINSGANTTITVTATIDAAGAFENEATADADEPDPTPGNNTDDDGDTAAAEADVSLTKTLTTAGPFTVGDTISFDIVVANAGPSAATNVQVTDVDTNLTVTGVSGSGCAALPCTIASINSGANTTITVTATIDANGAFENEATADADEPDPTPGNNTDDDGDIAGPSADVSVVKTLTTAGPFSVGDTVSFDIVVANAGPSTATNVEVTDVDTNLTITGVSGSGCAALPCTIASINSGANTTITVTATIDADGAFGNEATATADEPDPDPDDNTDDDGDVAGPSADVSLTKTLTTAGPFVAGDTASFDIVVANAGPSTATGIDVTDTPSNFTITGVSGSGCAALPCTIASLASGANTTITVTGTIDANGTFGNEATATADQPDVDVTNNTDDDEDTAGPAADVSVTKTLTTVGPFSAGDPVTYTIVVANIGPSTATSIEVTDTPTNLSITSVSGGGCAAFPCTIASLASGANVMINVSATIVANGAFSNSATATADEPDPDPDDNTDEDGDVAGASADVSVVKTLITPGPFSDSDEVSFSIVISNAGPSTATSIEVTDTPMNGSLFTNPGSTTGACTALPCTIASLAPGASATINVRMGISNPGPFKNEATAIADEPDPNLHNNNDEAGGTASPEVRVSVVKTLTTAGPYTAGQSVAFSLLITNVGPSDATSIDVTDTPSNLAITGVSGACAALPCTIASLASGFNTTINVTATILANGVFTNVATAMPDEPDAFLGDNTDDDGGIAGPFADVSLVKTLATAGPFLAGDSVTWTIAVSNAGPSTATGIDVTDTPANVTITSVSGSGCAALPCTIASLASGASTNITVTGTIAASGAFSNSATATADEPDPDPDDNEDQDGDTAGEAADVSVVKTLETAGPFTVGDSVTYTITVSNAGPSTATGIDVTDTPTNLNITGVSGACPALPCTILSLPSGGSVGITVTATINAAGAFSNGASAAGNEPDPDPTNNDDEDGDTADPLADVSVVKTLVTAGPFSTGQAIQYTLVIANAGPSTATSIDVTDTPSNLNITNVSGACAALPCTIASLASGASANITVTATINAAGAFDNVATANADEPDPDTGNNTDDDGNNGFTGPSADLSVVKTLVTPGPFDFGQEVTYTLVIANAGPSAATNIDVTDTPTNLTITGVSGACAALPCTIASLAAGADTTITVTATITTAGAFDNVATATADEPDPDPDDNEDDTGNDGVAPMVDIQVVKTSSVLSMVVGDTFDFTIVVTNNGPDTATGVVLTDPLPANFALAGVTSTQGTCNGTTTVTCSLGTMLNGASITITITGQATAAGDLFNTATVEANESEAVTANNASSATPIAAAAHIPAVPTASEWGLIVLAMLLAAAAVTRMRLS